VSIPGAEPDGMLIPFVAVGEDRGGNYVFVLEPAAGGGADQQAADDGYYVARRRDVTIDTMPNVEGIPVLDGLVEGELIATAGVRRLVDGQIVTLLAD